MSFFHRITSLFAAHPRTTTPREVTPAPTVASALRPIPANMSMSMSPMSRVKAWHVEPPTPHTVVQSIETAHDSVLDPDELTVDIDMMSLHDSDRVDNRSDDSEPSSLARPHGSDDGTSLLFGATNEDNENWHEATKKVLSNVEDLSGLEPSVLDQQWSDSTVTVLDRIRYRGHEPLIPHEWSWDFRFLPDILFAPPGGHPAFINALNPHKQSHGVKALSDLFKMAARARDCSKTGMRPETVIVRHIDRYMNWAMIDAGIVANKTQARRLPQTVVTITPTRDHQADQLELPLRAKFARLEQRWMNVLDHSSSASADEHDAEYRPVPVFYGFLVSHTLAALVCSEAVDGDNQFDMRGRGTLRSLALFELGKKGYDVWNALVIAIVVMRARDEMLSMIRSGHVVVDGPDDSMMDDPDV